MRCRTGRQHGKQHDSEIFHGKTKYVATRWLLFFGKGFGNLSGYTFDSAIQIARMGEP